MRYDEETIICECTDGAVIFNNGQCSEKTDLGRVLRKVVGVRVSFIKFEDVTSHMLCFFTIDPSSHAVLKRLRTKERVGIPRYAITQLLAMQAVEKLGTLRFIGRMTTGSSARDWRADLLLLEEKVSDITQLWKEEVI